MTTTTYTWQKVRQADKAVLNKDSSSENETDRCVASLRFL